MYKQYQNYYNNENSKIFGKYAVGGILHLSDGV